MTQDARVNDGEALSLPTADELEHALQSLSVGTDDQPQQPTEGEQPPSDEGAGEGQPEGDKGEQPLSKPTLGQLLNDPDYQSELNRMIDRVAERRVASEADKRAAEMAVDKMAQMTPEEMGEAFKANPALAKLWADAQESAQVDAVAKAGQAAGYTVMVAETMALVRNADLPDDVKASLGPESYNHLGAAGIYPWHQAVTEALIEHGASKRTQAEIDERWEAYKANHLAELDTGRRRPDTSSGRVGSGMLPFETDSNVLLEEALSKRAKNR